MAAARYAHYLLLLVSVCVATRVVAGFDLNAMPEDEEEPETMSPPVVETQAKQPTTKAPTQTGARSGRVSKEQVAKLKAIQEKVQKLFKVLEICDTEQFELDAINVSETTWSESSKAMMVLGKVAKQGLIRKAEVPRLKRILANCDKIDKKMSDIRESKMSIESQMSGVNYDDALRFKQQLESSPFSSMRDNLFRRPEAAEQATPTTTTTTPRPVATSYIDDPASNSKEYLMQVPMFNWL